MSGFSQKTKAEVRAAVLATRRATTDRSAADAAIRATLVGLTTGRDTVAGYVPLATEPGGPELPDALAAVCRQLLVPVTLPDRDLDWVRYPGGGPAVGPGPGGGVSVPTGRDGGVSVPTGRDGGVSVPAGRDGDPAVLARREDAGTLGVGAIGTADLVIVPAVAVDRTGLRLGRGGGSYDRALTRVPEGTLVVAAVYDGEFVGLLPAEPHDRRVAAVVTPSGLHHL